MSLFSKANPSCLLFLISSLFLTSVITGSFFRACKLDKVLKKKYIYICIKPHLFVGWEFTEMLCLSIQSSMSFSQTFTTTRDLLVARPSGPFPTFSLTWLTPCLHTAFSSFPCFGFCSITFFGFYLFAFGRLNSILVKSPQSRGLCSVPALLLVCLPVT